ncbi:MAG: metal ABC transporter permease [Candidatus Eremiobacteraeota bacterium]|nr:metal ABC transporter permease [Candidatus Eremiobacteraeota bacterium]
MSEMLHYTFMQRALLAGTIIGALCAVIGVYIVLRGMSFIGAGISHASFGGVALGFLLGVNPVLAAVVFCVATALAIGVVARKGELKEDTAVGIFFSATMAAGILFIGLTKGYNVDLFGYLFGSILAVTGEDIAITLVIGGLVIALVGFFFKELEFISFDAEMAEVVGIPQKRLYFLLLAITALTIVASIKVVGIVLVSALIITPAATAYQLADDFRLMMVLSVVFGVSASVGGLVLSCMLNTASGATIVILATAMFFAATIVSPRRIKGQRKKEDS